MNIEQVSLHEAPIRKWIEYKSKVNYFLTQMVKLKNSFSIDFFFNRIKKIKLNFALFRFQNECGKRATCMLLHFNFYCTSTMCRYNRVCSCNFYCVNYEFLEEGSPIIFKCNPNDEKQMKWQWAFSTQVNPVFNTFYTELISLRE